MVTIAYLIDQLGGARIGLTAVDVEGLYRSQQRRGSIRQLALHIGGPTILLMKNLLSNESHGHILQEPDSNPFDRLFLKELEIQRRWAWRRETPLSNLAF